MPRVTVVTPNFNHARYLPQRIESILGQTFDDFELLILDNASTDHSRDVIEPYTTHPRVRAVYNPTNNGSPFKQWSVGLTQARGDYVWFAESDDYAERVLLETLVDRLDCHPSVGLAVCQSLLVDEDGQVLGTSGDLLEKQDHSTHWRNDYVNSGHDECRNYMFWHNTIPNASAVLWRRHTLLQSAGVPVDMALCGDWMAYINMLQVSDIAYVAAPLNHFRQHQATVRTRAKRQGTGTRETLRVQQALANRYGLRSLRRDADTFVSQYVADLINGSRMPPHNKVPPTDALRLLGWFARIHPRAFSLGLRTLSLEQAADLARRAGVLKLARKLKGATTAGGRQP